MRSTHTARSVAASFLALLAAVLTAHPASAQQRFIQHQLSFQEVDSATGMPVANPNGILEPGEGAKIALSLGIIPSINTILTEPPILAGFRVHAAARTWMDLASVGQTEGTWSSLELAPGWDAWNGDPGHGYSASNGRRVTHILPMQDAAGADTRNPVPDVWSGIWVPADFTPREAHFWTSPVGIASDSASRIWLEFPNAPGEYVDVSAYSLTGQIYIPIIPAPSAALTLALATVLALRRRR